MCPCSPRHVIGGSPDAGSQVRQYRSRSRDGIRRDMGVITPDGVVGKILAVYPDIFRRGCCWVTRKAEWGALLVNTRTQALWRGMASRNFCWITSAMMKKYLSAEAVVTSGQDRISRRIFRRHGSGLANAGPQDALHAHLVEARPRIWTPRGSSGPALTPRVGNGKKIPGRIPRRCRRRPAAKGCACADGSAGRENSRTREASRCGESSAAAKPPAAAASAQRTLTIHTEDTGIEEWKNTESIKA